MDTARRGRILAADVARILRDPDEPRLVFQPIVDLRRAVVAGFEALARFTGPPVTTPDQWFAAADEAGHGAELEARVITRALGLRQDLPPNCFLAINVSPHLLPSPEVQTAFAAAGELTGVVVELTEHIAVRDQTALIAALDRLRAAKAHIAIDDAGSGYAGLQQLLSVRPQLVKLDRNLVDHIDDDEIKRAMAEMLGSVAGRMDAWLLAEGIERAEELEAVIALGVPLAQGWIFGKPATDWLGVDPDLATRIRLLSYQSTQRDTIVSLIQPARQEPTGQQPVATAGSWTIEVDANDCPLSLHSSMLGPDLIPITLRVHPTDSAKDTALRALARDPRHRFDPIVAVDETGRLLGVVLMERLFGHLTAEPIGPTSATPDHSSQPHEWRQQ